MRIWIGLLIMLSLAAFSILMRRDLAKRGRCGKLKEILEDRPDEHARQGGRQDSGGSFTGSNCTGGMAGASRSRRRLSPARLLPMGRRDLQPFLHAGAGRAAQFP